MRWRAWRQSVPTQARCVPLPSGDRSSRKSVGANALQEGKNRSIRGLRIYPHFRPYAGEKPPYSAGLAELLGVAVATGKPHVVA